MSLDVYLNRKRYLSYDEGKTYTEDDEQVACDKEGFDLDICELDKQYFDAGLKRYNEYKSQLQMF